MAHPAKLQHALNKRTHDDGKRQPVDNQVFGISLHENDFDGAATELLDRAERGDKTRVTFINAHCINEMSRSSEYNLAVRSSDYVLPDGSGIALANLFHAGRKSPNLNGTDLAPVLFEKAAQRGLSVYFFGGMPGVAQRMCDTLETQYPGLRIAGCRHGFFHPDEEDKILSEINQTSPDIILIAMGVPRQDIWLARVYPLLNANLAMGVGGLFDFLSERIPRAPKFLRDMGMEWVFRMIQEPRRLWRRYIVGNPAFLARTVRFGATYKSPSENRPFHHAIKRLIDVLGSGVGLVIISPVLIGAALAIRLESNGPVIFRQQRIGLNGEEFTLLKFRSMTIDADRDRDKIASNNHHGAAGVTFKMSDNPRITVVGKFIRKYSIDELPQLWNVLRGEMSLVGPRPALPTEVARYNSFQLRRLEAKPGITCTWQVAGRADIPFEKQAEMDIDYIREQSFWTDVKIILLTPLAVLAAKGAY